MGQKRDNFRNEINKTHKEIIKPIRIDEPFFDALDDLIPASIISGILIFIYFVITH